MSNYPLHNEIDELLRKYHAGTITPQEYARLSELMHTVSDEELLDTVSDYWDSYESSDELSDDEINRIYNGITPRLNKTFFMRVRRHWMQIAASLFVLILGGLSVLSYEIYQRNKEYGRFQAVITELDELKTDTSRQVILIADSSKTIHVDKGAVIAYNNKGNLSVNKVDVHTNTEDVVYNQLIVPKGKYSHLFLSDGTEIYVNAGSKVVYPNKFVGKKREIYVDGEIALYVEKDAKRPFIVKTSSFDVKVLGTTFNVRSYKGMEKSEVVLAEGSVEVTDVNEEKILLVPDEMLSLNQGHVADKKTVNSGEYMAWTKGRYLLTGKDIESILHGLSQYYGVDITYDDDIKSCEAYGTLDLHLSLDQLLDMMTKLIPVQVDKMNNRYHIYKLTEY